MLGVNPVNQLQQRFCVVLVRRLPAGQSLAPLKKRKLSCCSLDVTFVRNMFQSWSRCHMSPGEKRKLSLYSNEDAPTVGRCRVAGRAASVSAVCVGLLVWARRHGNQRRDSFSCCCLNCAQGAEGKKKKKQNKESGSGNSCWMSEGSRASLLTPNIFCPCCRGASHRAEQSFFCVAAVQVNDFLSAWLLWLAFCFVF